MDATGTAEELVANVVASVELEGGRVLQETQAIMLAVGRGEISRAEADERMLQLTARIKARSTARRG